MRRAWPLAALTLLLLSAPCVDARDWTEKQVQEILAERIDRHHKSVGLAVGWVDAEGSFVVGYGKLADDDPRIPDGKTVYEIGSITKVFTGILLADMVARGEVELNEPVQQSLPDEVTMPRDGESEITLYHLTTHTSGLPRMPSNFSPADPSNPYADYSVEQMYTFLGEASLTGVPGENASYSNLGVALLGHVLALRAGMSYEALVRERIAGPLGMKDTVIVLTPALEKRLAQGHTAELEPTPNWDMPTVAGAGALRSTVDDMLIFLAANLGLKKSSISKAMETSHEAQEPFSGLEIGYGWVLQPAEGGTIHWHNGGTGGYRTFAGFNKERQVGVVVLSNASISADDIGLHLLDATIPLSAFKTAGDAVKVDAEVFDTYVGSYQLRPEMVLTITREGSRYFVQPTGQNKLEVFPESETKFFATAIQAAIIFHRDEDGKISRLVLHQGGAELEAPLIVDEQQD